MSSPRLGRVQLRIMQVLWAKGKASAREITDALQADFGLAHSTVQTLLRKLEAKKAVAHRKEDRTFLYYSLVKAEKVTRNATRDLINRVFGGSAADLVAYLLRHESISSHELSELRKLVEAWEDPS